MLKILPALLVLASIAVASTADQSKTAYKPLSPQEKAGDKEASFSLSFDNNTTVADHANGNAFPLGKSESLGLRGADGFDHKNAFNLEPGEKLRYETKGNIDHAQGTIIIWVMAENYSPKDIKATDKEHFYKPYLLVRFENTAGDKIELFLYQFMNLDQMFFYWGKPCRQ